MQLILLISLVTIIGASTKTSLLFDCKIEYNETDNSYEKSCHNVESVNLAESEELRKQLGPEISFLSPIKSIPVGYKVCQAASSISGPPQNGMIIAFRTEKYCSL